MIAEPETVSAGFHQTDVGTIPKDWQAKLLDDVAVRGSGHTPSKGKAEYWNGDIRWISLQDTQKLDHRYVHETAATITPAGIANSSAVMHTAGTVVLSRDAGVGKSGIMATAMAVSQHFIAWRCGPELNNEFLYYWLQSNKREFERIAMGNTIKTIGLRYFRELKIPLPPLVEQEAIAEALGDADAWIESLEQLVAKERNLKQAAMQQLLTGKTRLPGFERTAFRDSETGEVPLDWEVRPIGNIADVKTGPFGSALHESDYVEEGTPIITVEHLGDRGITRQNLPLVSSADLKRLSAYKLQEGDIVFSRVGSIDRNAMVTGDEEGWLFSGRLLRLRSDRRQVDSSYLSHHFHTAAFKQRVKAVAVGQTMPCLNTRLLSSVFVVLPTVEEQSEIARVLSDMDDQISATEVKLAKARQIKRGMMQELLTGRTRLV